VSGVEKLEAIDGLAALRQAKPFRVEPGTFAPARASVGRSSVLSKGKDNKSSHWKGPDGPCPQCQWLRSARVKMRRGPTRGAGRSE
jgi:hypothetical protein